MNNLIECNDPYGCTFDCSDINCNDNILICWNNTPKCELIGCNNNNCNNIRLYSFANVTNINCNNGCNGNNLYGNQFYCGNSEYIRETLKNFYPNNSTFAGILDNQSNIPINSCQMSCNNTINYCQHIYYECNGYPLSKCQINGKHYGNLMCNNITNKCAIYADSPTQPPSKSPTFIEITTLSPVMKTSTTNGEIITWNQIIWALFGILVTICVFIFFITLTCLHYKYKMKKQKFKSKNDRNVSKQNMKRKFSDNTDGNASRTHTSTVIINTNNNLTSDDECYKSDYHYESNDEQTKIVRKSTDHRYIDTNHRQNINDILFTNTNVNTFNTFNNYNIYNIDSRDNKVVRGLGMHIESNNIIPSALNMKYIQNNASYDPVDLLSEPEMEGSNWTTDVEDNAHKLQMLYNKNNINSDNDEPKALPISIKTRKLDEVDTAQFTSHPYKPQHERGKSRTVSIRKYDAHSYSKMVEFGDIKYQNDGIIGSGHFGDVFKGTYKGLTVAIKVYKRNSDRNDKDFYCETVVASDLNHENLVNILGYCVKPFKCILMTYVDGCNLREYCYRDKMNNKWNNIHECIIIYLKVLKGLLYMHKNNIIHRDIAARNILINVKNGKINKDTEVRLTDYGSTRHLIRDKFTGDDIQNDTYSFFGPVKWMSPEAIQFHKYSNKSDIYMFGMTMYEIFYRMEPYPKTSNIQVAMGVTLNKLELPFPPQKISNNKQNELTISIELKKLIVNCIQYDFKDRITGIDLQKSLRILIFAPKLSKINSNDRRRSPSKSKSKTMINIIHHNIIETTNISQKLKSMTVKNTIQINNNRENSVSTNL